MTDATISAPGSATQLAIDRLSLANDLRLACQRIARRVRFESTADLPPHMFAVLARVNRVGPQTPTQLAEHDRVSAPSMTRTINALCERGLVEKQPHPSDGRQVLVTATAGGAELVAQTISQRDLWMLTHIGSLDEASLTLLRQAADLLMEVSNA